MMQGCVVRVKADDERKLLSVYSIPALEGTAASAVINKRNMQNVVFFYSKMMTKRNL